MCSRMPLRVHHSEVDAGGGTWGVCDSLQAFGQDGRPTHTRTRTRTYTHALTRARTQFVVMQQVDPQKCEGEVGEMGAGVRCPPEAFGEDGGMTYNLMTNHVVPILRQYCREMGEDDRVELDWYLPP